VRGGIARYASAARPTLSSLDGKRWRWFAATRRRLGGVLIALAVVGASAVGANADTKSDLEAAEDRLEHIRGQLEAEEERLEALQGELNAVAAEIEAKQAEFDRIRLEAAKTRRRIDAAERRLETLRSRLNEHARDAYMNGPAGGLELILGATSLADLSDRIEFLGAEAQQDVDVANEVENQVNLLERDRADLELMLERQGELLDRLKTQREDLQGRFAEQQRAYDRIESLRDEAAALVRKLEDRLEAEQVAWLGTTVAVSGPGPLYACPVAGPRAYASTFGQIHNHPGWTHAHQGNDILSPYGTPIVAPFDGNAIDASSGTGGLSVSVYGAQGYAIMMHMSRIGQLGSVRAGDVIGYIGTTGNTTTPHTHFEWHPGNGAAVDPYPYLNEVC